MKKMDNETKYKRPLGDGRSDVQDDSLTRLERKIDMQKQKVNKSIEARLEIKKDKERIEEKFKLRTTPYWQLSHSNNSGQKLAQLKAKLKRLQSSHERPIRRENYKNDYENTYEQIKNPRSIS